MTEHWTLVDSRTGHRATLARLPSEGWCHAIIDLTREGMALGYQPDLAEFVDYLVPVKERDLVVMRDGAQVTRETYLARLQGGEPPGGDDQGGVPPPPAPR